MASQTEVEAFLRDLRKKGMPIHIDVRKKHIGIWHDGQMICVVGKTPGSQRWRDNVLTTLRRNGLELTEPKVLRVEAREKRKEEQMGRELVSHSPQTASPGAVSFLERGESLPPPVPSVPRTLSEQWEVLLERCARIQGGSRGAKEALYRALPQLGVGSSPAAGGVAVRNILAGKASRYSEAFREAVEQLQAMSDSEFRAFLRSGLNGRGRRPAVARMDKALRSLGLQNNGSRWKLLKDIMETTAKALGVEGPALTQAQLGGFYRQLQFGGDLRHENQKAYEHVLWLAEHAVAMREGQKEEQRQAETPDTPGVLAGGLPGPAVPLAEQKIAPEASGLPLHLKVLQQLLLADADEDTIWNATFAVWRSEQ